MNVVKMVKQVMGWGVLGVLLGFGLGVAGEPPVRVVATTAMVGDLVQRVGGGAVVVEVLMGPGVDPHAFNVSASDVRRLNRAEVIFYNGLMLEGRMDAVLARMGRGGRTVYAVTEGLPRERLVKEENGAPDPHVWFDVALWAEAVDGVAETLAKVRPDLADKFRVNGAQARVELGALHAWSLAKAAELPVEKRVLITSHDAYSYFGRAYGFEVVGLQGISTVAEAALADVATLVDFIKAREVKAVFIETSVSPAMIRRISQDSGARIGGELFSDAMGAPGELKHGYDTGTYEGMVRANFTTIVEALK